MRSSLRALAVAAFLCAPGCARPDADAGSPLEVHAAASLQDALRAFATDFEARHHASVRFTFAGSQTLATQARHGARGDLFLSADLERPRALEQEGLLEDVRPFACNTLVLLVPSGNAKERIDRLEALPDAERIVLAAPEVPAGAYAEQVLKNAEAEWGHDWARRVRARIASRELNVRQAVARVALGEADAALAYRTDAASAKGVVEVVELPDHLNVVAHYGLGRYAASRHALADEFAKELAGDAGQAVLSAHGFLPCPPPGTSAR